MSKLWKVNCSEDKHPGMWQRWYANQCAAIGWGPGYGFTLEGPNDGPQAWSRARNCMKRVEVGDWIVVSLRGHRVGRLGQVTELKIQDHQWNELVPAIPDRKFGEMGRRINVRWDLTCGPQDREQVIKLPEGSRFSPGELRPTICEIKSMSLASLKQAMTDSTNWTGLLAFNYERSLSEYIAAYPHRLEDGMLPHPYEKVREKVFDNNRRSDVLLVDQAGQPVVVECKQYHPTIQNIAQLRGYMRSLKKETGETARGVLVHGGSRKLSEEVRLEAEKAPRVELVKYSVEVDFLSSQ